ncbi:dTMP kinase [Pseudomonas sp. TE3610]
MNHPLFVSLDGPKGTGKTTLLEAITHALRANGSKVIRLSERNNDPYRAETMALVNQLARNPDRELELRVCERLAQSRAWISQHVLPQQAAGSIVLIDRWYPSDAAFRRLVPFAQILQLNLEHGVRVPDLLVGVVTAPEISWARASARTRGLGSTVMFNLEQQVAATQAFELAAAQQGWVLCRNEGTVEEAVRQVVSEISTRLG